MILLFKHLIIIFKNYRKLTKHFTNEINVEITKKKHESIIKLISNKFQYKHN